MANSCQYKTSIKAYNFHYIPARSWANSDRVLFLHHIAGGIGDHTHEREIFPSARTTFLGCPDWTMSMVLLQEQNENNGQLWAYLLLDDR